MSFNNPQTITVNNGDTPARDAVLRVKLTNQLNNSDVHTQDFVLTQPVTFPLTVNIASFTNSLPDGTYDVTCAFVNSVGVESTYSNADNSPAIIAGVPGAPQNPITLG